jgi:hypothetical protein
MQTDNATMKRIERVAFINLEHNTSPAALVRWTLVPSEVCGKGGGKTDML